MDFKAYPNGDYVASFEAKDLPAIIRLVRQGEIWRKEEAEKAIEKIDAAEQEQPEQLAEQ